MKLYRYKTPENDFEKTILFKMIEDRGVRALYMPVKGFEEMQITPTFVHNKTDLEVAYEDISSL